MGTYVVGITGASGSVYGKKLMERLIKLGQSLEVCMSETAIQVMETELGWKLSNDMDEEEMTSYISAQIPGSQGKIRVFKNNHIGAAIASGSHRTEGMIVIPCSMGTVSAIAHGASDHLIERAADVMLKEGKSLLLVPREAPFSTLHLKNLFELSTYGVKIIPASPSFYHNPQTMDELLDFFIGRVLNQLGFDDLSMHWEG